MADDDEGLYDELYGDDDDDVPIGAAPDHPARGTGARGTDAGARGTGSRRGERPGDGDGGDDDDSDDDFDIALNEPEERGSDEEPDEFMIQLGRHRAEAAAVPAAVRRRGGRRGRGRRARSTTRRHARRRPGRRRRPIRSDPLQVQDVRQGIGAAPARAAPGRRRPTAAARAGGPRPPAPPPGRPSFAAGGSAPAGVPRGTRARLGSHRTVRAAAAGAAPRSAVGAEVRGPAVRPPPPLQMEDGTWNTYNRQPPNARYNEKGQRMMPGGEGGSRFIPPEEYKEFTAGPPAES